MNRRKREKKTLGKIWRINERKLLAWCAILSIIGVTLLYGYAVSVKAGTCHIRELGSKDIGTIVLVTGHVKETTISENGNVNVILIDLSDGAEVIVFVSKYVYGSFGNNATLIPGSEVSVEGYLEEYSGNLEIVVSSPDRIRLLHGVEGNRVDIRTLLECPNIYASMAVNATGTIYEITTVMDNDRIEVVDKDDTGGRLRVSIEKDVCYRNRVVGDVVDILGSPRYFPYSGEGGRWEITVAGSDDNVSSSSLQVPQGYIELTLPTLVKDIENFEGKAIAVKGVRVANTKELVGTSFKMIEEEKGTVYGLDCIVYGMSLTTDVKGKGIEGGCAVSFIGRLMYYPPKGCWQLVSDENTILLI